MKLGDLVRLRSSSEDEWATSWPTTTGIITDMLEDESGFHDYLVLFTHGEEWIRDIQLEVLSDED